jgi:O-antigen ligase
MIKNKILFFKNRAYFSMFMTIVLAFCAGYSILFGFGKLTLGFLLLAAIFLYFRRVEDLFLFWLLTFSFFSVDSTALLTVGTHPIITYDRVFIVILLIMFAKEIVLKQRNLLPIRSVEISFLLFLSVVTFSVITKTDDKMMGARVITDMFLLPFLIYFLSKHFILTKGDFDKFVNIIFTVGIYLSIMAIYEHFSGRDILATERGIIDSAEWLRVNGPYVGPEGFGICSTICFFIALFKYTTPQEGKTLPKKVYILLILGMNVISILFCLFRGIWLSWALGFLLWFVIRRKGLIKLSFVIILSVVAIMPFIPELQSTDLYEGRIANVSTIQGRLEIYEITFSLFKENPITGIGFRNYDLSQHNTILALLSEVGIIGTTMFILFISSIVYHSIKKYKLSNGYFEKQFSIIYLSILVSYLVPGLGLHSVFIKASNLLFFAVSGVALNGTRNS